MSGRFSKSLFLLLVRPPSLSRLLIYPAVAVAFSSLFANDAIVQKIILFPLRLDAIRVYDSVYGGAVSSFPDYSDWVGQIWAPIWILAGFVSAAPVLVFSNARPLGISLVASAAITVTVIELILSVGVESRTAIMLENFFANLTAGILFSAFILLVCSLLKGGDAAQAERRDFFGRSIMKPFIIASAALFLSSLMFLCASTLLRSVDAQIDFTWDGQSQAYFGSRAGGFPALLSFERGELNETSIRGSGLELFSWAGGKSAASRDVDVYFHQSCLEHPDAIDFESIDPAFLFTDLQRLQISSDAASYSINLNGSHSLVDALPVELRLVQPIAEVDGDESVYREFIADIYRQYFRFTHRDELYLSFLFPLIDFDDGVTNLRPVNITFDTPAERRNLTISTQAGIDPSSDLLCGVNPNQITEDALLADSITAGFTMRISPSRLPFPESTSDVFDIVLFPRVSWISMESDVGHTFNDEPIEFDTFIISSSPGEITLGRRNLDVSSSRELVGHGDLRLWRHRDEYFRINGSVSALWDGSGRLLPTRWEAWDWNTRSIILSVLFGGLLLLSRTRHELISAWRDNRSVL